MIAGLIRFSTSDAISDDDVAAAVALYESRSADIHRTHDGTLISGPREARGQAAGISAVFTGWIDNEGALQALLNTDGLSSADLYAAAVARWGRDADRHVIGNYAAICTMPGGTLRLARSPWDAPPIYHARKHGMAVASPLMRALFAAGIERRYDFERMVDELAFNWRDTEEAAWHHGVLKVPLGAVVELSPGGHDTHRWYQPPAQMADHEFDEEAAVEQALALLDEAAQKAWDWAGKPALALSGGLDSPLVATSLLRAMPEDARLTALTFEPDAAWDGSEPPGLMGDETPLVRELVATDPRFDWHRIGGDIGAFDKRAREVFSATEVFAPGLANVGMYHGLYETARAQGCDALLTADYANETFSDSGRYSYREYARPGRIGQLLRLLRNRPGDSRSLARKVMAMSILPVLPRKVRATARRLVHPQRRDMSGLLTPLSPAALDAQRERAKQRGEHPFWDDQNHDRSRAEAVERVWAEADGAGFDVDLGFEQLYGVRRRDVTVYRPLVEFCLSLPARAFAWDGQERRLARAMGKGRVPESIRTNTRHGQHNIDWHARITPHREAMLGDIQTMRGHPWLAETIDLDRMERLLTDWPDAPNFTVESDWPRMLALPRMVLAARFVGHLEGRNDL